MDEGLDDLARVRALRELLPASGAGILLDAATAGPLPTETHRALLEADDWELRVGRGGRDHAEDAALRRDEARGVLAAVLGVGPDRVTPVMGIGAAITAVLVQMTDPAVPTLRLDPGLEPAVCDAAAPVAAARGWRPVDRDEDAGVLVAPAVRADDGAIADVPARRAGLPAGSVLVLDLTFAAGAVDLPRPDWDAAILATDRWLLGPEGTAASVTDGRGSIGSVATMDVMPRRAALGVARSVGTLLMAVGLPWATTRTAWLARRLRDGLAAVPGVRIRGSHASESPVVALDIAGWSVEEAAAELGRRVFAITGRTPDGRSLRLGVGAWNTPDELDRFVGAIRELAAHTPETLPRRPGLTVLTGG